MTSREARIPDASSCIHDRGRSKRPCSVLRWLRERIGLSRDQLAAASGVSAVHIKFIERGKRNPSEAVIQRLLPALRVTRHDLDGLLSLRPWARSTASGEPATLSTYAAGVPLAVAEGSEFDAAPARPAPAPAWPRVPRRLPSRWPHPASRRVPCPSESAVRRLGAYRASAPRSPRAGSPAAGAAGPSAAARAQSPSAPAAVAPITIRAGDARRGAARTA